MVDCISWKKKKTSALLWWGRIILPQSSQLPDFDYVRALSGCRNLLMTYVTVQPKFEEPAGCLQSLFPVLRLRTLIEGCFGSKVEPSHRQTTNIK